MDSTPTVNDCNYPACLFYPVWGTEDQIQFELSFVSNFSDRNWIQWESFKSFNDPNLSPVNQSRDSLVLDDVFCASSQYFNHPLQNAVLL